MAVSYPHLHKKGSILTVFLASVNLVHAQPPAQQPLPNLVVLTLRRLRHLPFRLLLIPLLPKLLRSLVSQVFWRRWQRPPAL